MEHTHATHAFATLGHPGRLAVFRLLMRFAPQGVRPTEMAEALGLKQNTLSHHLADLTASGLVRVTRQGRSLFYAVNLDAAEALIGYLALDVGRARPDLLSPLLCAQKDAAAMTTSHRDPDFDVLFICSGNSARSIFAEALLRDLGHGKFQAFSAGTRPNSQLNPFALEILRRNGHDTAALRAKHISEFQAPGSIVMDFVFTVCDTAAAEAFKAQHGLTDAEFAAMQSVQIPSERAIQDYRSAYNDIRDWLRRQREGQQPEQSSVDWDDVVFEVDLLKSQEINLDYILELIFDNNKKVKTKAALVEEVRRAIRASLGNRAKESLLVDFINQTDLSQFDDKASVIEAFFTFAQAEQLREAQELISSENLNADAAKRYIVHSLKREYASDNGTELNAMLPKMSPLNPLYLTKKQTVFQKVAAFVEKFKGVGGAIG